MTNYKEVAIVTGGGQGIGKCIAQELLKINYVVVLAESDCEAGKEAQLDLKDFGEVLFLQTDVQNESSVICMIEETVNRFGNINLLINNAAVFETIPIDQLTLQEWNNIINTNLTGTFLCCKYASAHLGINHGSIINIGSSRAFMSEPNTEAYTASKGAIISLTHALAISLAPEIRVNCISPGWIEVRDWNKMSKRIVPEHSLQQKLQHPSGRIGTPYDIASMVLYLANNKNSFITGQNIVIDGGMSKKILYF